MRKSGTYLKKSIRSWEGEMKAGNSSDLESLKQINIVIEAQR